jgi:chromosome partitioning protein
MALGDRPLRVLLVDVDFQGTLSDVCADPQLVELQLKNGSTVVRLLGAGGSNGDLASLMTPMSQVPGAKVILANDELEAEDYRLQAEYFVNKDREVRYLFRNLLHRESVYNQFDLVLFDCPPRLTTSAVNALACSDYVLIPTKLDPGSINAVPRTLRWLDELAGVVPAQLLGVVVNQATHRVGKLTRADQNSYTYLCAVVAQCKAGNNGFVFQATVKSDAKIVPTDRGLVASIEKENRELFIPLVTELRERIQI